ncbi:excalibur calcium-binding domain-containing protein [Nocardia thraciensis]
MPTPHVLTVIAATGLLAFGAALAAPSADAAPRDGSVPPGSSGAAPSAGGSGWSDSPHETVLLPPSGDESGYPFYATCAQVWAEHGGPLYPGQRGYRGQLDTDGNGVACDPPQ